MSRSFSIRGVRAVTPDGILDEATVVVEDGTIVSLRERGSAPAGAVMGHGLFCMAGLVDTHSDGLEKEIRPRPGVELPIDFALHSFEGRIRAAGITTMYHGIGFENGAKYQRTVALANLLCDAIEAHAGIGDAIVDHRILYRLDARDSDGFDALVQRLSSRVPDGTLPLVSFEDHTPGQGQYTDRTAFERYLIGTRSMSAAEAKASVDTLISEREQLLDNRTRALPWLSDAAGSGQLRFMAHDPTNVDEVDEAIGWNASIAEFPTTVDAARHARHHGLRVVCGAPNVLRGSSHSGNVSATELVSLGLCDALASDYLPSALLGAVAVLANDGQCSLPEAAALVTSGPADTVGLTDRGRMAEGQRADLVLVGFRGRLPTVRSTFRAEDHKEEPWTSHRSPALTS